MKPIPEMTIAEHVAYIRDPKALFVKKSALQVADAYEALEKAQRIYVECPSCLGTGEGEHNRHCSTCGGRKVVHKTLSELTAERDRLKALIEHQREQLDSDSIVASCNCGTKTNETEYHKPGCKYRLIQERDRLKAYSAGVQSISIKQSETIRQQDEELVEGRSAHYALAEKNRDLEARVVSLTSEVDQLDAIRRQQEQDNLDLIAKLDSLRHCPFCGESIQPMRGSCPP